MPANPDHESVIRTHPQRGLQEKEMVYLAFDYLEISFNWQSSISSRVIMQGCTLQNLRKVNYVLYSCNTFFTLIEMCEIVNPTL